MRVNPSSSSAAIPGASQSNDCPDPDKELCLTEGTSPSGQPKHVSRNMLSKIVDYIFSWRTGNNDVQKASLVKDQVRTKGPKIDDKIYFHQCKYKNKNGEILYHRCKKKPSSNDSRKVFYNKKDEVVTINLEQDRRYSCWLNAGCRHPDNAVPENQNQNV